MAPQRPAPLLECGAAVAEAGGVAAWGLGWVPHPPTGTLQRADVDAPSARAGPHWLRRCEHRLILELVLREGTVRQGTVSSSLKGNRKRASLGLETARQGGSVREGAHPLGVVEDQPGESSTRQSLRR